MISLSERMNEGFLNEANSNYDEMSELAEKSSEKDVLLELEKNLSSAEIKEFFDHLLDVEITLNNISKIGLKKYLGSNPKSVKGIFSEAIRFFSGKQLRDFANDYRRLVLNESKYDDFKPMKIGGYVIKYNSYSKEFAVSNDIVGTDYFKKLEDAIDHAKNG